MAIRVAAAGLNSLVTLLEAYLEAPEERAAEVKRRLDQVAANLRTLDGVTSAQVEMLLNRAAWARRGEPEAAQQLWAAVAAVRDELVERHSPPPEPRRPQW